MVDQSEPNVSATVEQLPLADLVEGREAWVFHRLMIGLMLFATIATHIDGWVHAHYGFAIESFFTPAHYPLYTAWLGATVLVLICAVRGWRRGRPRSEWLPRGYNVSALGVAIYWVGGVSDAMWHTAFGFELNFEFTLSPPHLTLLLGAVLAALGVVRHALFVREARVRTSWLATELPLALGMVILLVRVLWPTWYFDPLTIDYASGGAVTGGLHAFGDIEFETRTGQIAGVSGMLLSGLILTAFVVVSLHRWRLPVGAVTLILLYPALLRAAVTDAYAFLPALVGAALAVEALWAWLRSGGEIRLASPNGYRVLASGFPIVLFALYFAIAAVTPTGIAWPVTMWLGAIFLAGGAGALLGFALTLPPAANAQVQDTGA